MNDGTQKGNTNAALAPVLADTIGLAQDGQFTAAIAALTRSGWKTTEFWRTLLVLLVLIAAAYQNVLDPRFAAAAAVLQEIAYLAIRSGHKSSAIASLAAASQPTFEVGDPLPAITPASANIEKTAGPAVSVTPDGGAIAAGAVKAVAIAVLAGLTFSLNGCATGLKRSFAKDVDTVSLNVGVTGTPDAGITGGTIGAGLKLRDPRSLAK